MTQRRFFRSDPRQLRSFLQDCFARAEKVHLAEKELISTLDVIDQERIYTQLGYNSLVGFCHRALGFTRQQSLRLARQVRNPDATPN